MPCMLVSPDSLARFFPPRPGLFDLVVFDEASQIRVADAVGAMGRGRSVVVVGDSKQMPPDLVRRTQPGRRPVTALTTGDRHWAEDEVADVLPAEDEESILSECVQARVPQRWLSWHYRSQDESLIAFSNRQYYAGGLSSFPAPLRICRTPGSTATASTWSGWTVMFHRSGAGKLLRTNPIEAQAVVDEIRRRFLRRAPVDAVDRGGDLQRPAADADRGTAAGHRGRTADRGAGRTSDRCGDSRPRTRVCS